jgi:N-acetylmuramoyl-L-alanine amidase CwlA
MSIPSKLPGLKYAALPAGYGGKLTVPPRLVIVHMTDNPNGATAEQEASYAHTRTDDNPTSAHAYVDTDSEIGSVPLTSKAWAALAHGNSIGWQIELCNQAGHPIPAATIKRAAALVAKLCKLGGIPIDSLTADEVRAGKHGIAGHDDLTRAYPEDHGDHTDPKWTEAQWAAFIAQVKAAAAGPVPTIPAPPTIKAGSTGRAVQNAQLLLYGRTYLTAGDLQQEPNTFGPLTAGAVKAWQTKAGITVDGICGNATWRTLLNNP